MDPKTYLTRRFQSGDRRVTNRFRAEDRTRHFFSILREGRMMFSESVFDTGAGRVALTGSALTQMKLGQIWDDSDLDVVIAGYGSLQVEHDQTFSDIGAFLPTKLDPTIWQFIHKFTQDPLEYNIQRQTSAFHHAYQRLKREVSLIVTLGHVNTQYPVIQLIFASPRHPHVFSFIRTFDMYHCQGRYEGRLLHYPPEYTYPHVMAINYDEIQKQTPREWIRFLDRVLKYMERGMVLRDDDHLKIFMHLCEALQYRPSKRYDWKSVLELLKHLRWTKPFEGINVTFEGTDSGMFTIRHIPSSTSINVFDWASPIFDLNASEALRNCLDIVSLDEPECASTGVRILFNNKCTAYSTFAEFKASIKFFRPCGKEQPAVFYEFLFKSRPSLCMIPLEGLQSFVPTQQLYACIRRRLPSEEGPIVIVIDSNITTTYEKTASDEYILNRNAVSRWHCQQGSKIDVRLCRNAYTIKEKEYMKNFNQHPDYYRFEEPLRDDQRDDNDDTEDDRNVAELHYGRFLQDPASQRTWTRIHRTEAEIVSIASSSDGEKLVAVSPRFISTSTDFGSTWDEWECDDDDGMCLYGPVASSNDGMKLVVAVGGKFLTSRDSGGSWTRELYTYITWTRGDRWNAIASSSDGTKLVAVNNGSIWTSTDSGRSFTERLSLTERPVRIVDGRDGLLHKWGSVASSANGEMLVAVAHPGYIWTSTDAGVSWTNRSSVHYWTCVTASADGVQLVAAGHQTGIWTSIDAGVTWTTPTRHVHEARAWKSLASSSDGRIVVALEQKGSIWISTNSGLNWTRQTSPPGSVWFASAAMSACGTIVYVATEAGDIWKSRDYRTEVTRRRPLSVPDRDDTRRRRLHLTDVPIVPLVPRPTSDDDEEEKDEAMGIPPNPSINARLWTECLSPLYNPNGHLLSTSLASSSDGRKVVMSVYDGHIYTSTNSGRSWRRRTLVSRTWKSVASSEDGTRLVAVSSLGYVSTSTDSGVTWTTTRDESWADTDDLNMSHYPNWESVGSSSDGTKIVVLGFMRRLLPLGYTGNTCILTSIDSGSSWTLRFQDSWSADAEEPFTSVASSSDGEKLVAVQFGFVWRSTDSGVSWTRNEQIRGNLWSVASSTDGTKLVVVGNRLLTSRDSGNTWIHHTENTMSGNWRSVVSSADGTTIAAAHYNTSFSFATGQAHIGHIWLSSDSGVHWAPQIDLGEQDWQAMTMSSDGTKMVVTTKTGKIFISPDPNRLGRFGDVFLNE